MGGEPLSYHPVFASGPDVAVGLWSPSRAGSRSVTRPSPQIGLWGGNCARGGIVAASDADLRPTATATSSGWPCRIGVRSRPGTRTLGSATRAARCSKPVTGLLAGEAFTSSLNPGHLVHYDEWLDSPIRTGSSDPIASGMVIQSDIIPTGIRAGWTTNCEDTVAVADAGLRAELESRHPTCGPGSARGRTSCATSWASQVRDEVLPLSCTPAYLRPFWLAPALALAFA